MRAVTHSRRSSQPSPSSVLRASYWTGVLAAASMLAVALVVPAQAQSSGGGASGSSSGGTGASSGGVGGTGAAGSYHTPTTAPSQPGATGTTTQPYAPSSAGGASGSGTTAGRDEVIGGPSPDDFVTREQHALDSKLKGICRGC